MLEQVRAKAPQPQPAALRGAGALGWELSLHYRSSRPQLRPVQDPYLCHQPTQSVHSSLLTFFCLFHLQRVILIWQVPHCRCYREISVCYFFSSFFFKYKESRCPDWGGI